MAESTSRRPGAPPTTEERLLDAADRELAESGHAALTVRLVARRAGLSPATAYKIFASKDHLLSAVFLRHLRRLPEPVAARGPVGPRVARFLQDLADVIAAEPELRAALRSAFMSEDSESGRIRDLITEYFEQRFQLVCGDELDGARQLTIRLAFAGAMVLAGAGMMPFTRIEACMTEVLGTLREPG